METGQGIFRVTANQYGICAYFLCITMFFLNGLDLFVLTLSKDAVIKIWDERVD